MLILQIFIIGYIQKVNSAWKCELFININNNTTGRREAVPARIQTRLGL